MTDTTHRKTSSSRRSSSRKDQTDWDTIGFVAAASVVFLALMGYAAFCPWNPFAAERDAQAVAERVQKVGSVVIAAAEPAPEAAPAPDAAASGDAAAATDAAAAGDAAAAPAAADEGAAQDSTAAAAEVPGKKLYGTICQMCHAAGISGAPKFGSKEEWAPRIATGMDAMMKVVFEGKGAMPARGASTASDDELRAAVQYMVDNAK